MGLGTASNLTVSVDTNEGDPSWVQLAARGFLPDGEADLSRPEVSDRWAGVVREVAAAADVTFGYVGDGGGTNHGTALEDGLRSIRRLDGERDAGRRYLRSYSWITVCSQPVGERLGGAEAVTASGAFARVEQLPKGGLWLQATSRFGDYDLAAMRRVFVAVAPVLPDGVPQPDPMESKRYGLVWENAAWYRPDGQRPWPPPEPLASPTDDGPVTGVAGSGSLRVTGEGYELAFTRELDATPERVWCLLTEPDGIVSWFGWIPRYRRPSALPDPMPPCSVDLEPGGQLVLPYPYPADAGPRISRNCMLGSVSAVTPLREVRFATPGPDGPGSQFGWTLERTPSGGVLLRLTVLAQVTEHLPSRLADWHCRLDALATVLAGQEPALLDWWKRRWPDLYTAYRAGLGLPPLPEPGPVLITTRLPNTGNR
jgi:uncharacterized protein YndB with AHSA1/START domain